MSPIFVRLLGLPLLSPAFSFLTAVRGLSTLAGPPLAGALVDYSNDKYGSLLCSQCRLLLTVLCNSAVLCNSVMRNVCSLIHSTSGLSKLSL
jgi:hypothetical protein